MKYHSCYTSHNTVKTVNWTKTRSVDRVVYATEWETKTNFWPQNLKQRDLMGSLRVSDWYFQNVFSRNNMSGWEVDWTDRMAHRTGFCEEDSDVVISLKARN
jgi:hypothetical protein